MPESPQPAFQFADGERLLGALVRRCDKVKDLPVLEDLYGRIRAQLGRSTIDSGWVLRDPTQLDVDAMKALHDLAATCRDEDLARLRKVGPTATEQRSVQEPWERIMLALSAAFTAVER